jgi:S-DNA-T family DNA segregation ATPase FtsK/SpoIIIE
MATQSPTKDSIPREVTRNVSCGVAFSVADQVANDGLLGSGKYAAGIRATELRINTDRGTCVAVGITDETFELVRTFYVPFEDGADDVTPVIGRALALIEEMGRAVESSARPQLEAAAPVVVDHLADVAAVLDGEKRVRTQVVLTRLARHDPGEYGEWTFRDLKAALAPYRVAPVKSDGNKVIRADDVAAALARQDRDDDGTGTEDGRDAGRDPAGTQGLLPDGSLAESPGTDQGEHGSGTPGTHRRPNAGPGRSPGDPGPYEGPSLSPRRPDEEW